MIDIPTLADVRNAIRQEGRRIFDWWARHSVDGVHGGFVGEVDADGQVVPDAPKAAILNTRLLWYFSAVYRHSGEPLALELAQRAARYIRAHFIDPADGGLWWMLDAEGRVIDERKHAYVQAFAIYAFAEFYAATGDGLTEARGLQAFLDARYWDEVHGGWLEAPVGSEQRLSDKDLDAPKTMNTHLHLLEAYTRRHQVAPDAKSGDALQRALQVFVDRFLGEGGHLRLFFGMDWTDLSEAVSFGHDIEASWLVWEAAEALGDEAVITRLKPRVLAMAQAVLTEGVNADGGIKYERRVDGHEDAVGEWWCQAEALVGFLNAYQLNDDVKWLDALRSVWRYCVEKHGLGSGQEWTWYPQGDARRMYLMGAWKCPYHNGRAMMELERRLHKLDRQEQ